MTSTKDEYASHMYDITETSLDFYDKSGMCGWPTILGILGIMVMHPESYEWLSKSGINTIPKVELGDTVHWYKIKYDLRSNIRRSVPISLLNGTNVFTTKNIPEPINSSTNVYVSKNSVYFMTSSGVKVCSKSELDLRNCKSLTLGVIQDVTSKGKFDYVLTRSAVYRVDSSTYDEPTVIFSNAGSFNSFCVAGDYIIVAGSSGAYKLSGIEGLTYAGRIERETGTQTSTDANGNSTNIPYDNGVPDGECRYCWYDGSRFYVGDYSTCGDFLPSDNSYSAVYTEGNSHPPFITSGTNKNHNGVLYCNKNGGILYGSTQYAITEVTSILELDNVILFGTNSGIHVYTKTSVDGNYGPQKEYVKLTGVNENINGMCLLYGTLFVIGQSTKYRSFDSEEDENKLRFIVFGTDYDVDTEANETDAKEVKLNLFDLLDLGLNNSTVFNNKLAKAKVKTAQYAIAVYNNGKPKVFNLYGHDNRNAPGIELNNCLKTYDMEMQ